MYGKVQVSPVLGLMLIAMMLLMFNDWIFEETKNKTTRFITSTVSAVFLITLGVVML